MKYVIGIKKKLFGSEQEVEWRYASAAHSGKPEWTKIASAVGFVGIADAKRWWEEHAEELLSDPNVLKKTAEIRKMTVETEEPLPYDFERRKMEAQARAELERICAVLRGVKKDVGDELFSEIFEGPIAEIIGKSEKENPSGDEIREKKPKRKVSDDPFAGNEELRRMLGLPAEDERDAFEKALFRRILGFPESDF